MKCSLTRQGSIAPSVQASLSLAAACCVKLNKEIMRIILLILLIISSLSASAIVVRHDVNDKKYLAAATDFSPLATLYIDGAHGTLIKPEWIVTAAHATFCISPGSYIRLNNGYHKVESVFVHKDYQPGKVTTSL
jgi:hypothetical protein